MWKNFEAEKIARELSDAKLKEAHNHLRAEKVARENADKEVEEEKSRRLAMESAYETRKLRLFFPWIFTDARCTLSQARTRASKSRCRLR